MKIEKLWLPIATIKNKIVQVAVAEKGLNLQGCMHSKKGVYHKIPFQPLALK